MEEKKKRPKRLTDSRKVMFCIDAETLQKLDTIAEGAGITRSSLLRDMIEEKWDGR